MRNARRNPSADLWHVPIPEVLQSRWRGLIGLRFMRRNRPRVFKGRHFEAEIIILCVRWYLRFGLSFRNLKEIMAERNLTVDHVTIWRWVQRYAPELHRRCRRELRMTNRSWRVDETYLRVAGQWTYLYRAVDSSGATIDFLLSPRRDSAAAKRFFSEGIAVHWPSTSACH
jgi:IS6 family transposase